MVNGKTVITGASGLLGVDLVSVLKQDYQVTGVSTADFDIRNYDEVSSFFNQTKPEVVLHAAAWADVNRCEKQKERTFEINALGSKNIALACKSVGARMIYYSTDYVFDGTKGQAYTEDDNPNPVNNYGRSKLEGERYVLDLLEDAAVMRISWLYGTARNCFVGNVIRAGQEQILLSKNKDKYKTLKVVDDQFGCPTWTVDIARQTKTLIENNVTGIIHSASIGKTSRYKLAREIFKQLSMEIEMEPVTVSDFPMKAPRPKRTDLENRRLNQLGLSVMRDYKMAIREFLAVSKKYDRRKMQY